MWRWHLLVEVLVLPDFFAVYIYVHWLPIPGADWLRWCRHYQARSIDQASTRPRQAMSDNDVDRRKCRIIFPASAPASSPPSAARILAILHTVSGIRQFGRYIDLPRAYRQWSLFPQSAYLWRSALPILFFVAFFYFYVYCSFVIINVLFDRYHSLPLQRKLGKYHLVWYWLFTAAGITLYYLLWLIFTELQSLCLFGCCVENPFIALVCGCKVSIFSLIDIRIRHLFIVVQSFSTTKGVLHSYCRHLISFFSHFHSSSNRFILRLRLVLTYAITIKHDLATSVQLRYHTLDAFVPHFVIRVVSRTSHTGRVSNTVHI